MQTADGRKCEISRPRAKGLKKKKTTTTKTKVVNAQEEPCRVVVVLYPFSDSGGDEFTLGQNGPDRNRAHQKNRDGWSRFDAS